MTRYNISVDDESEKCRIVSESDKVYGEINLGDRTVLSVELPDVTASSIRKRIGVRYAESDGSYKFIEPVESDVETQSQTRSWGVERIGAPQVHANGYTGDGVTVGVIDSGTDSNHPDLEPNLVGGSSPTSCVGEQCIENWDDDNGHGTHCAGIVGAVDNDRATLGVAPDASLYTVKVLGSDGYASWFKIANGITNAVDYGVDIISMSIGGTSSSSTVRDALQYAVENDIPVIVASGNTGPCTDCVLYPAKFPETIAVSSSNSNDELSSFSSTGPEIDIIGTGSSIRSTRMGGGTVIYSGTSMACPHVAGVAALIIDRYGKEVNVREKLLSTAEDIGLSDNEQGSGLVDAVAAVGDTTMVREQTFSTVESVSVGTERSLSFESFRVSGQPTNKSSGTGEVTVSNVGGGTCYVTASVNGSTISDTEFTVMDGSNYSVSIELPAADADYDVTIKGGIVTSA